MEDFAVDVTVGQMYQQAQAAEKKLAGAAKTSFVTKCVKDAAAVE